MANRGDCKRLRKFRQPDETTRGRADSVAILLDSKEKANRCRRRPILRTCVLLRRPKLAAISSHELAVSMSPQGLGASCRIQTLSTHIYFANRRTLKEIGSPTTTMCTISPCSTSCSS
jgi:hypothetical protein